VFSPNGKNAFRIMEYDAGATGGGENVVVYRNRGLFSETVFSGGWESIASGDVRWVGDADIWIESHGKIYRCSNISGVTVHCLRDEVPFEAGF
jgi:hypothetical protein